TGSAVSISNNVVYRNSVAGIQVSANQTDSISNNTIVQVTGDAIRLSAGVSNVKINSNILQVQSGFALNVPATSIVGLVVDNNILSTSGTGKLASYASIEITTPEQLRYVTGLNANGQVSDPKFIDADGADDLLGNSRTPVGSAIYRDDTDAVRSGIWNSVSSSSALNGGYLTNANGTGDDTLTWLFTGLTPGQTYQVAVSVPSNGLSNSQLPFQVFDGQTLSVKIDGPTAAGFGSFVEGLVNYRVLGYYTPATSTLSVRLSDGVRLPSGSLVMGDAVRLQAIVGDRSADDDFHLRSDSPAIDAGDRAFYYSIEPYPNGGRIDAGAYGNTTEATLSNSPGIQVLSPGGLEKWEQGSTNGILLRSHGLTNQDPIALINSGGTTTGRYLTDRYRVGGSTATLTAAIDLSQLSAAAPLGVYQTYAVATSGVGAALRYQIPVPDGDYSLRLHFVDPTSTAANQRKFDVRLQGSTVQNDLDIFAVSGAVRRATTLTQSLSAAGGNGVTLELVNKTSNPAVISGIELFKVIAGGTVDAKVNLESSVDDGVTWTSIATNVALDRHGDANFNWIIPADYPTSNQARVRAISTSQPAVVDSSDGNFKIVSSGNRFYINDGATSGDEFTTAVGNDANSGRSPHEPMASLSALLEAYDLDAGDTVYVDSGNYALARNIIIDAQDAGLRLQGPLTGTALFNRGNTSSGAYGIELRNADGTQIDHLQLTGGEYGIYAGSTSDSDNLSIAGNTVFNNSVAGIYLEASNDQISIQGNRVYGTLGGVATDEHSTAGIQTQGTGLVIADNEVFSGSGRGIRTTGASTVIQGNTVSSHDRGIDSANGAMIVSNTLTANVIGILATQSIIDSNTISGNASSTQGIRALTNSVVRNNTVSGQQTGIDASTSQVEKNLLVDNSQTGLRIAGGSATGNTIRNSVTGLLLPTQSSGNVTIANNLLVNNSLRGVLNQNDATGAINFENNTIVQPTGSAIELNAFRNYLRLKNNVIASGGDFAIKDALDSQLGFESNYNLFFLTNTASLASWQGQTISSLTEWSNLVGHDRQSISSNPLFTNPIAGDYSVQSGSPTIDAGDPNSTFLREPYQHGNRINQGHTGNTEGARASAPRTIQVVSPNGSEKLQAGRSTTLVVTTSGLLNQQVITQVNSGGAVAGSFLADSFRTSGLSGFTYTGSVDTSPISDPPPDSVFRNYAAASSAVAGNSLTYHVPLPDGSYSIRLFFLDPSSTQAGVRRFDVRLQGEVVDAALDLFATSGGTQRVVARSYPLVITGGQGAQLNLTNVIGQAILSGMEIVQNNPMGLAAPTVNLLGSVDNGLNWISIATNVPINRYGQATYVWNLPVDLIPGANFRVRATSAQLGELTDDSDRNVQIARAGQNFYINDAYTAADSWTTAPGDDANDGKSPDRPMRTLATLLDAYDLDPNDVVYVDNGTYALLRNVLIQADDAGVRITGSATGQATLHRGYSFLRNSNGEGHNTIQLQNADNVTLANLVITGGYNGIYAPLASDNDNVTITGSTITANQSRGIAFENSNDGAVIQSNLVFGIPAGDAFDNQNVGIEYLADNGQILSNTVRNHAQVGISSVPTVNTIGLVIRGNDVFGNSTGILANRGISTSPILVDQNIVHDNIQRGIEAFNQVIVSGNTVYGHTGTDKTGIFADSGVEVFGNIVHSNFEGIRSSFPNVHDNRIYNNSSVGLTVLNAGSVRRNTVYSNSTGIATKSGFDGDLTNNLVYANANFGVDIQSPGSTQKVLVGNSILQLVGDAVRIINSSNSLLTNNIVVVQAGTIVNIDTSSQTTFRSNHNLLYASTIGGRIGVWGGVARVALADWQTASGQDILSVAADPLWVDVDGQDNRLGYGLVDGTFRDGGPDDNFTLQRLSPAIDRGIATVLNPADAKGRQRLDDPGVTNSITSGYTTNVLSTSLFTATGVAQNWRSSNTSFAYTLPFAFKYFDTTYTSLFVSTSGFLQFGNSTNAGATTNSTLELSRAIRIAGLWDALSTTATGRDIYVDTSIADQVKFRWQAELAVGQTVNFAIVLFADGRIRFDYGPGTAFQLSPTVGISSGNRFTYQLLAAYDSIAVLASARSVEWIPQSSIVDLGAYEFRGSSLDVLPVTVLGSTPGAVHDSGLILAEISQIKLLLSEPLEQVGALSSSLFELRSDGGN
ncbi:MAG: right-handed parallel beta-helix repeat-containing protein, partial [Pirellulaceae bacterium]|nr:right-handed parallel beta-helix repeat-containing protein [Pirellulaceae bacterium]